MTERDTPQLILFEDLFDLEEIQNIQEMYIAALCNETLLTKRQLKKMLDQKVNVYLTAEEAVEYGLADEVI